MNEKNQEEILELVKTFCNKIFDNVEFDSDYVKSIHNFLRWYSRDANILSKEDQVEIAEAHEDEPFSVELEFTGILDVRFLNALSLFKELYLQKVNRFPTYIGVRIEGNTIRL